MPFAAARQPTFYFIGVTTGKSSIMRVFPAWARYWGERHLEHFRAKSGHRFCLRQNSVQNKELERSTEPSEVKTALGLENAQICGIDFAPHSEPESYREAVSFIKNDPLSLGCLVTTHKLDLYAACKDLFDEIDPHARLMAETSCLSKREGRLICHAKDPISSGLALDGFLPPNHFANTGAEVFSMGAGGSTIALTWHLMQKNRGRNRPSRVIVSNRSQARLDHIRHIHDQIGSDIPVDYVLSHDQAENDRVLEGLREGSLVINATGLGKDAPGSPISNAAIFPEKGIVWDLNYRGCLVFLDQARAQSQRRQLQIEDGWTYFIHGWTQVIAEVFDITIPTSGPDFDAIARIASDIAGR